MAAKNRWNSQRFLERIPEAELEWKMTVYRKDLQRFQRNQRMERTKLWNLLFRNSRELNDSIVARYSMNDVLSRRVSVDELKKIDIQQQSPTAIVENDRQFDAFKAQLSAQLKLSDSDRVWQEPQRPNYEDLRRADYRPSPKDLNARNISRLLLDETFFSQLLHHSQDTVRDADAEDISRTINGQVIDSKQTALTVGGPNSSSGRHLPPTWMKMVTVDEAVRSSRRFNRADISPGWRATYASDDDDIERRRATGGDEYGGHFDGRVADEETANCCDDAGSHQRCLMLTAGETPTTLPPIVETTVEHSSSTDISRASSASPQQRQSELRLPQIVK